MENCECLNFGPSLIKLEVLRLGKLDSISDIMIWRLLFRSRINPGTEIIPMTRKLDGIHSLML